VDAALCRQNERVGVLRVRRAGPDHVDAAGVRHRPRRVVVVRAAPPLCKRHRPPGIHVGARHKHDTISASAASACSPVACALAMPPVPTIPNRSVPAIVVAGQRLLEGIELAQAIRRGHVRASAVQASAGRYLSPHERAREAADIFSRLAGSLACAA
jgi:hypothetical protein